MIDFANPHTQQLIQQTVQRLVQQPEQPITVNTGSDSFTLSFLIPNYQQQIQQYYADLLPDGLFAFASRAGIPFLFNQFGLQIRFDQATELELHDPDMQIMTPVRDLADRYGPVIFKNAYLSSVSRDMGHRNRFPHLSFHVDRSEKQPTPYSIFTRNPFDAEQVEPRTASTLLTANIVAYLQCVREKQCNPETEKRMRTQYTLFEKSDMGQVLGSLVLEQRWDEPRGTGEIVVQDNRTLLHASYYRDAARTGYRIGVRYVG